MGQPFVAVGPNGKHDYRKLKVDSSGNLLVAPAGSSGSATDTRIVGGNSATPVTTTPVDAKRALDVVVQDIHISHTNDSIQIGDGTTTAVVTPTQALKVQASGPLEVPYNADFIKAVNAGGQYIVRYYEGGLAGTTLKTLTFSNPGNEFELAIS